MPTPASIAKVRELNQKTLDLYAYVHSEAGQRQREAMRLGPAPHVRSATEAEIMQIAEALDGGALLNPRKWVETFTVREVSAQAKAAA